MDTTFGDKLPYALEKLINWIICDNKVQSWRFTCENSLTLSIRFINNETVQFTPIQTNAGQVPVSSHVRAHCYRSKPPSSVTRDQWHQQAWIDRGQYNIETNSTIGDSSNVYTSNWHSSDTGYCEMTFPSFVNNTISKCDLDKNSEDYRLKG